MILIYVYVWKLLNLGFLKLLRVYKGFLGKIWFEEIKNRNWWYWVYSD